MHAYHEHAPVCQVNWKRCRHYSQSVLIVIIECIDGNRLHTANDRINSAAVAPSMLTMVQFDICCKNEMIKWVGGG